MRNLTLEETPLAKRAYEHFAASVGVTILAYHADDGRFADKGLIASEIIIQFPFVP